jgi:hypothetical protein
MTTVGRGIKAPILPSAYLDDDGNLVFIKPERTEFSPVVIPSNITVMTDNGDSTWSVSHDAGS